MDKASPTYRRIRAHVSPIHINLIHYTNPWVVATWSFFFPGFGHLLLGEYALGWVLLLWELAINVYTNFNTAILYSFTGRFDEARKLLEKGQDWFILIYGGVFVFTLVHSYKLAIETNEQYYLAHKENARIKAFTMNSFQYNFLRRSSPLVGALWSLVTPSLGALWSDRFVTGIFELAWWLVILFKSHFLAGVEYTALGRFRQAVAVLDPEWILFIPSIYSFLFYYAYVEIVEINKLFDKEQVNFLVQNYQVNPQFSVRIKDDDTTMRFIASFNHSVYLEKVMVTLESIGIPRSNLFAAPLDKRNERSLWLDTIQRSDGKALFDGVALLGGTGCALGTIYGFVMTWGPVIWGLIGFVGGCLLGILIKTLQIVLVRSKSWKEVSKTEVFVIVDCDDKLGREVEDILWANRAFGISKINKNNE